jgi:chitinase
MQTAIRKNNKFILSLLAGSAMIASFAASEQARAATLNGAPTITSVTGTPTRCNISMTYSYNFSVADNGPNDLVFGAIVAGGANPYSIGSFAPSITSGSATVSNSFSLDPAFISLPPLSEQLRATVFDRLPNGSQVSIGSSAPISNAQLQSAGGACLQFIPNLPPTVSAANQTVSIGQTVTLSANANDPEGSPIGYLWGQTAGAPVTLSSSTSANPTFVATTAGTRSFFVQVNDGSRFALANFTVNVVANQPPVVNAGGDATFPGGSTVPLEGTASDFESNPLTYQWTQTGGTAVTLINATTLNPSFVAPPKGPAPQILTFSLVANDGTSNSVADTVQITIPANVGPTANAGTDVNTSAGSAVALSGTVTDGDGDPVSYVWTQVAGPTVPLAGSTTPTPSLNAPAKTNAVQTLTFELVGFDGFANSTPDTVDVTVAANVAPTANAGINATFAGGSQAVLNGSASSDGDGDLITYSWTQVAGPSVTLNGASTSNPTFTAPPRMNSAQTLTFALTVSDGLATSSTSMVDITIPSNAGPVADAGPDATRAGGTSISLNGAGSSDPEQDPITYSWTQVGGTPVSLTGATTATPSFVAPAKTAAVQMLTFQLVVNDGTSNSSDMVEISISANVGPSANAGQTVAVAGGSTVLLNGSASTDGDGDTLTYAWVQTSGTAVTLTGANTAQPSFIAPPGNANVQNLVFALTVSDGITSSTATVAIDVNRNSPPVANAGPDQGPINTGQTVQLNGAGSTDPDGNPLTYRWTQISGPAATLLNPTSITPSFVAPNVSGTQNLVFQLIVNDGTVDSVADTVVIAVRAVGTVTIVQRVVGADGVFSFTSDIISLTGTIATSSGIGQRVASAVNAGTHSVIASDARAAGYALTAIVCNDSDSVVSLANRSVAIQLSPNENLVCTFTSTNTRDAATLAIGNFLTARNAALLANRPDVQRRIDRLAGTATSPGSATAFGAPVPGSGHLPLAFSLAEGQSRAATSLAMIRSAADPQNMQSRPFDIWAEATFSTLRYDNQEGRFQLVYAGADYRIGETALVGALVQLDRYSPSGARTAGTVSGNGWMAGPYAIVKLSPNFYVDARAAWGTSDNLVTPIGTFTDQFETNRSLYIGALIGQFSIGARTEIRPELSVRYLSEHQKAYVDSLGVPIPSQEIAQGDISFRPRIHHLMALSSGWNLRPYVEADGIYSFGVDRTAIINNGLRLRLESGAEIFSHHGFRAGLSGFYDGIGGGSFENAGMRVSVGFGF